MKKVKFISFIFICFFGFIFKVNASCSYTRLANLKKLAANVNVTYTYKIENNVASFDIRFANLTNDIYLYDSSNNKKYVINGETTLKNFKDGFKYRFFIKSNDSNCKDEVLSTKYVSLPKYNIFYGDKACEGIEDYVLCQKWGSYKLNSYSDYIAQINKYKKSLIKEKEIVNEEIRVSLIDKIIEFLLKYYIIILSVIIFTCLGLMVYLTKKDSFKF